MSKMPKFQYSDAKVAKYIEEQRSPLPTIDGTSSSILSMQAAANLRPLSLRPIKRTKIKKRKLPRETLRRAESQPIVDLDKKALEAFMREGASREDRLIAILYWVLSTIDPLNSKAENIMALTVLNEVQGLLCGQPSRLFQIVGEASDAKITPRQWVACCFASVAAEVQWRMQSEPENKRSYPRAFMKVIEDIESLLSGIHLDDLLPDGRPGERKPESERSEEKSARTLRRERLAERLNNRRREILNGTAPRNIQSLYRGGLRKCEACQDINSAYQGWVETTAALFKVAHDDESMLIKSRFYTEE